MSKNPNAHPAPRKVLAYSVETNDPEESTIQFATSSAAARRQGADEIGADFGAVSCRRAQWADQYAEQRFIPAEAYIDAGWWFDCNHCGTRCDSDASRWDEETDTDIPLDLVFDGRVVYCSADCKAAHEAEVAARNAKFEAFKKRVVAVRPGVTFTEFTGGYPWCGNRAKFMFPGAQYGGSVSEAEDDTELKWYVAQGDKAAWDHFIAEQSTA
ncbi:hypothetical protein [Pseudomonas donghuensis]|uniref:hypothetical protein n=1 Tax=Pseudomonas donghuensis TaxID=1163398 RepID=UPI002160C81E|nr:hypothetical protein [Pseudomonas donghuensis]UVL26769.1 hypothetical protein LOY30_12575 [Pseudomonas donghuensis]